MPILKFRFNPFSARTWPYDDAKMHVPGMAGYEEFLSSSNSRELYRHILILRNY
jgi:hypothetical protein